MTSNQTLTVNYRKCNLFAWISIKTQNSNLSKSLISLNFLYYSRLTDSRFLQQKLFILLILLVLSPSIRSCGFEYIQNHSYTSSDTIPLIIIIMVVHYPSHHQITSLKCSSCTSIYNYLQLFCMKCLFQLPQFASSSSSLHTHPSIHPFNHLFPVPQFAEERVERGEKKKDRGKKNKSFRKIANLIIIISVDSI